MPAQAGTHRYAANHVPGSSVLVGRRDKRGDDVGEGEWGTVCALWRVPLPAFDFVDRPKVRSRT